MYSVEDPVQQGQGCERSADYVNPAWLPEDNVKMVSVPSVPRVSHKCTHHFLKLDDKHGRTGIRIDEVWGGNIDFEVDGFATSIDLAVEEVKKDIMAFI